MADIDLTSRIERLEVFEERLGVRLDSLSAFIQDIDEESIYLTVRGEIQALHGTNLEEDVQLVVAAYDQSGRVIGTGSDSFSATEFFGLEVFDLCIRIPVSQLSKIRIFPKKR